MKKAARSSRSLAGSITKSASQQTYYTIRLLADRDRTADAYRAYAYFRWVDDVLDAEHGTTQENLAFHQRQQSLLEACYRRETPAVWFEEERLLVDLVQSDRETNSGLHAYLSNMMGVMSFDAGRRGRLITQDELCEYSRLLATAVTEAIYYFIGHDDPVPFHAARYLAVTAAHITHMLRDAYEDAEAGYFNIPLEYLHKHGISAQDIASPEYRQWVSQRVHLARRYFQEGRACFQQVKNRRCRLAAAAYTARFEWMLKAIEKNGYCLQTEYPERKRLGAGLWMGWHALTSMAAFPGRETAPRRLAIPQVQVKEP